MSDDPADDVILDKYGRIVIPKSLRKVLGVEAGSRLDAVLEEGEAGMSLRLRPRRETPLVIRQNGHRVHTGQLEDDIDLVTLMSEQRTERAHQVAGLK
jgi:AbrB family looped-hinge helix DNA binding protein